MFVPAPRSLDYVSDRMPNIEYAHGLVAVVEGMHLKMLIFLKYSIVEKLFYAGETWFHSVAFHILLDDTACLTPLTIT